MKNYSYLVILGIFLSCGRCWALTEDEIGRIADSIKRAENSVKYPYGIKSINTHGDEEYARKICMNTVRNNYRRWVAAGKHGRFIAFLGDKYCPKADDPTGHAVWARNVTAGLKTQINGI